jgi:histone acetyltransferase MYST1
LVLPFHQKKGYGKFLIDFSYELSKIDGKIGSPEKPLSELGRRTYQAYWTQRIIEVVREHEHQPGQLSVEFVSQQTGIAEDDIMWTLSKSSLAKVKYGDVLLCTDREYLDRLYQECGRAAGRIDL